MPVEPADFVDIEALSLDELRQLARSLILPPPGPVTAPGKFMLLVRVLRRLPESEDAYWSAVIEGRT